jgi:hypothetical protein
VGSLEVHWYYAERAVEFLLVLSNVLASLHAVQHGEGYRVGYATSKHAETHGFAARQINAHSNPDSLEFVTWHHVQKIGVYVFAQPGVKMSELPL